MNRSSWIALAIVGLILSVVVVQTLVSLDLVTPGEDADSSLTASASGLEFINGELTLLRGCSDLQVVGWTESTDTYGCTSLSGVDLITSAQAVTTTVTGSSGLEFVDGRLGMLQGCSDAEVQAWDATIEAWLCATDATGSGANVALDLDDDDSNESSALTEIAITGDTNSIFTESAADKLLIALANNWPSSDTADALSADGADCASNEAAAGVTAAGVGEECRTLDGDGLTISGGTLSADLGTAIVTGEITDDTILEADLDAVDSASDEECLTFESGAGGDFEWQTCASSQNLFETFTNGTAIVADSATDTITIGVSGSAIATHFNAGTDTITFEVLPANLFDERSAVFVQTGDVTLTLDIENVRVYNFFGVPGTIQDASCNVDTAPTSSAVTVDINMDGTTIFTTQGNRPSIAAGNFFDVSGTPDVTSFASQSYLTVEMDAIDSGDTAADLTCQVRIRFRIYDSTS